MKNKSSFLLSLLLTILLCAFSSCKDESVAEKNDPVFPEFSKEVSSDLNDPTNKKTLGNFKDLLTKGMRYDEMVTHFGVPDADVGSGFHIYEYKLADGTFVWVGFTDHLIYSVHLDAAHNVIDEFLK